MRLRNAAFEAVHRLWQQRRAEGLTQQKLAEVLERDKGWVSRALRGPANWEFKTFARLVRALEGEAEITVLPLEMPATGENYHAYRDTDLEETLAWDKSVAGAGPIQSKSQRNIYFSSYAA